MTRSILNLPVESAEAQSLEEFHRWLLSRSEQLRPASRQPRSHSVDCCEQLGVHSAGLAVENGVQITRSSHPIQVQSSEVALSEFDVPLEPAAFIVTASIGIIVDLRVCSIVSDKEKIGVVETVGRSPSTNQVL